MATPDETNDAESPERGSLLGRVRDWATVSPMRSTLVAVGLVGLMAGTIGAWLVLAEMATPVAEPTMDDAYQALDEGDLELAGNIVNRVQKQQTILTRDYGGPLFVLGAIRAKEAEDQWAAERRRRDYLIAAKYLDEARSLGVPEDREYEALFLLGKSFIGSDQLDEGVEVLLQALALDPTHETEIHELLARAYYFSGGLEYPDYAAAVEQLDAVLAAPNVTEQQRNRVLLRKARAVSRLGRNEEALNILAELPPAASPAIRRLVTGQVLVRSAAAEGDPALRKEVLDKAEQSLVEAERMDKLSTEISGDSQYLRGKIDELRGREGRSMERYLSIRKRFGMSSAGIAASAAEGDLLRLAGKPDASLDAYRRALDAVEETSYYQSELLPLAELRAIILAAQGGFLDNKQFGQALTLIDQMDFLFDETRQLELSAATRLRWGDWLLDQATLKGRPVVELLTEGRLRLREAGKTYELLAAERFAKKQYPEDLWQAADAYYRGQSYTSAGRILRDYLKNEPLRRNATALLRLGQSMLALGDADRAVEAFEECIEFHPNDAATYGARLAAAKAYRDLGETDRAEVLLTENLLGSAISPRSPEWRDSKFELGALLHDVGRYNGAIDHLEEAINRYPDSKHTRVATYLVAESYRHAAEEPMEKFREAKAVNERENNERLFRDLLEKARDRYETVQREISRSTTADIMDKAMLRNCYMLKGSVLFDLGRYKEAVDEYSNVSALYQNEPFVLETLVQISHCWRRLGEPDKARGNIDQALVALNVMPKETDFLATTTRSRIEWESLLNEIRTW
ncbi:MAG: tetratricopeptide repeat protein [Planctomycetota bacterium]